MDSIDRAVEMYKNSGRDPFGGTESGKETAGDDLLSSGMETMLNWELEKWKRNHEHAK